MARYLIPYQNLDMEVLDEGPVFRPSDESPQLYKRIGGNLYVLTQAQIRAALKIPISEQVPFESSLARLGISFETINPTIVADTYTLVNNLGGGPREGTLEIFRAATPRISGEVYTQVINPENPQGTILTSNRLGLLRKSPSLAEQAAKFGISEAELLRAQRGEEVKPEPPPASTILEARAVLAAAKAALKEEGRFDYGKLPAYPHMSKTDTKVWNKFIDKYPNVYVWADYDEVVGEGRISTS